MHLLVRSIVRKNCLRQTRRRSLEPGSDGVFFFADLILRVLPVEGGSPGIDKFLEGENEVFEGWCGEVG